MTVFHWACLEGYSKIAKLLIEESTVLNIDLYVKDNVFCWTGFHYACYFGRKNIVEMILNNSKSHVFDLNAFDSFGRTGYQLAQEEGMSAVVTIIKRIMPSIAIQRTKKEINYLKNYLAKVHEIHKSQLLFESTPPQ